MIERGFFKRKQDDRQYALIHGVFSVDKTIAAVSEQQAELVRD